MRLELAQAGRRGASVGLEPLPVQGLAVQEDLGQVGEGRDEGATLGVDPVTLFAADGIAKDQ